jgi:hypothetical protein
MQVVQRKPKKRFVQVEGNPAYAPKISQNKELVSPVTGTADWGQFPAVGSFPAGPIRLKYGVHLGPERGFGLEHIFEARKLRTDAEPTPMAAINTAATLIHGILTSGAEIFYEGNLSKRLERAAVFKSKAGTVIVEQRADGDGNAVYYIITAIPNNRVRGVKIGTY